MAIVHLNIRRAGAIDPLFVFGLGEGTRNVPIRGFAFVPRNPVYTLRPRPGAVPRRYKTAENPATLSLSGAFGHPTAPISQMTILEQAWTGGYVLSVDGNDHITHGFDTSSLWVIDAVRVTPTQVVNGIATEVRYTVTFEEAVLPDAIILFADDGE